MTPRILCLVIGYAFGLFQTAYILGKINGMDIRSQGSGNAGSYVFVYSPKYGCCGWVNAGFLR